MGAILPGPCAPVAIYREHPHGLSQSPDCNYGTKRSCDQTYDVGVWQAVGLLGQVIQGHPGLDMVVVARNLTVDNPDGNPSKILWDALRPAVIAEDPMYARDPQGFCDVYGGNDYAPDWVPFM